MKEHSLKTLRSLALVGSLVAVIMVVWYWDGHVTFPVTVLAAEDSLPITVTDVWVSLSSLDSKKLSFSVRPQDSLGRLLVKHTYLRRFQMTIGANCRVPVQDTLSLFRSLFGSGTYYLRDTWGYPPQIDWYCPVTPGRDAENRPRIVGLLERDEVRHWLQPWVDQGLRHIATEALTWDTPLDVGTWEFTVVEPHFLNMGWIPPDPPYGPLILLLRYFPFGSNCRMTLRVLELKDGGGLEWEGPDRSLEVQLEECRYDGPLEG